jgi:hypothetical protein
MKRQHPGVKLWLLALGASVIAVAACGARSSLEEGRRRQEPMDTGMGGSPIDAGPDVKDASPDVKDASPDVKDAGPDVEPFNCEEAGVTFVYLITAENDLYRFYPPDLSFTFIGHINCSDPMGTNPYSMGVDRKGTGYVLFSSGQLYAVSTATAACKSTSFSSGEKGFSVKFGMGFSANKNDPGEKLYVAEHIDGTRLATIDTTSMELSIVGSFGSSIGNPELTGTADGRLFGFGRDDSLPSGFHFSEIDSSNANALSDTIVPVGESGSSWAFAFWGGDFYFFTSIGSGTSVVTRLHPDDGSLSAVATLDRTIVGAGVSTCAPE